MSLSKIRVSFRTLFFWGGIACLTIFAGAYWIEYQFGIEPCPLCVLQRYVLLGITGVFLIGTLHNVGDWGRIVYCSILFFLGMLGVLLSSRHVWLQYADHPVAATCTAGLEKMLSFMPLLDVLKEVLTSSNACSKVDFTVFHVSLATWSFLFFLGLTLYSILIFTLQTKRRI